MEFSDEIWVSILNMADIIGDIPFINTGDGNI